MLLELSPAIVAVVVRPGCGRGETEFVAVRLDVEVPRSAIGDDAIGLNSPLSNEKF